MLPCPCQGVDHIDAKGVEGGILMATCKPADMRPMLFCSRGVFVALLAFCL